MIAIPKRRFIRPGQRHPYRKGTQTQIDERRGYVARLLRTGKTKTEIHGAVRDKFNVQWRQCDRYIAWLAPARTGDSQSSLSEMAAKIRFIYGDAPK
jgi:hypothetical protein